jgi:hypothetical protein
MVNIDFISGRENKFEIPLQPGLVKVYFLIFNIIWAKCHKTFVGANLTTLFAKLYHF